MMVMMVVATDGLRQILDVRKLAVIRLNRQRGWADPARTVGRYAGVLQRTRKNRLQIAATADGIDVHASLIGIRIANVEAC